MDPGDSDEPSREELESRVAELEQTVSKMMPDRRGVLKGLGAAAIGGAAIGGATGGASGQSAAGQIGTASEPVDVEGGQGNFDSVSTVDSLIKQYRNGRAVYRRDEEWATLQAAIDSVADSSDSADSGLVELDPFPGDNGTSATFYALQNDTLPILAKRGVTLDLTGTYQQPIATGDALYSLEGNATVLGAGANISTADYSGPYFEIDDTVATTVPGSNDPTKILGYPKFIGGSGFPILEIEQSNGSGISAVTAELGGQNSAQMLHLNSADGSGFINGNTFRLTGSTNPDTDSVVHFEGPGKTNSNIVYFDGLQVKGGDHFLEIASGKDNHFYGTAYDPANVTNAVIEFGPDAGGHNIVEITNQIGASQVVNNSGEHQLIKTGTGMVPFDLSGFTGRLPGYQALDDGTNTAGSGLMCTWTGSAWQPSDGSAIFQ